jgi:hypothetical protein
MTNGSSIDNGVIRFTVLSLLLTERDKANETTTKAKRNDQIKVILFPNT